MLNFSTFVWIGSGKAIDHVEISYHPRSLPSNAPPKPYGREEGRKGGVWINKQMAFLGAWKAQLRLSTLSGSG
jgi:hypothetical protein